MFQSPDLWLAFAILALLVVGGFVVLRRSLSDRGRTEALEAQLREAETRAATQSEAVSRLEAEKTEITGRLSEVSNRLEEARQETSAQKSEIAKLVEGRTRDREAAEKSLAELTDVRTQMTKEFKLLADQVLTTQGQTFKQQNQEQLGQLLNPLRQKLTEFQQGMTTAEKEAAKERTRLAEQIEQLGKHSSQMSQETLNLTRALKGDSQVRGAWGEMVLQRLLEISGLREGHEFITQASETLSDGTRLRPDVIVNLPGDRRLVVDSKLSLVAYEQYANAEDEASRRRHLADHQQAMKTHIQQLSRKDYVRAFGLTPDYVIMFVPIEGAFAAALEAEPDMTETALRQNITLSAPTTLITVLRSVAHIWQVERQHQNAEEIADRAGKLYDKFEGFVGDMASVRQRLEQAATAHDKAMGKLSEGPGNLVRQVENLKQLGAKAKKSLPDDVVEASGARQDLLEGPPSEAAE